MIEKPKPDALSEARRLLGLDSTPKEADDDFLEARPKQVGVKPDIWKQAARLLASENATADADPQVLKTVYSIQDIDWEPGDDDPILKTSRSRGASRDQSVKFQKYQFRLFANAGRNSHRNAGRNPNKQVGAQRWVDGDSSARPVATDSSTLMAGSVPIATVAQSMPKGFSVGVPSTSLDFIHVPRHPTPETAWVFSEVRLKDFIVWKIAPNALLEYEKDPDGIGLVRLFASALKAYFNLYNFFLIGQSDKGFVEDSDFQSIQNFWSSEAARRRARSRLIAEGLERYGLPPQGKDAPDDYDPERVKRTWPIFRKMIAQAIKK